MNKAILAITSILSLFLFSNVALAQTDEAIIATDINSPDLFTASAAGSMEGAPVLVAEDGDVSQPIIDELKALKVKRVILVGGPVVIKETVEVKLQNAGFETVRLFGIERTATAIEVAKYFWVEGVECIVLVEDTENSDEDAESQLAASNLAIQDQCAHIPIPKDRLPAEVLAFLEENNVKKVKFIGKRITSDIREKLKEFSLEEFVGDKEQLKKNLADEVAKKIKAAGKKAKLVVVAVPDWRVALGVGSHPNLHSVVKQVSSVDQVSELVQFINDHNITDVKVVGTPSLAGEIATALEAEGITVVKIAKDKAHELSRDLVEKVKVEWELRSKDREEIKLKLEIKIRGHLNDILNKTKEAITSIESEIEDLEAAGHDVSEIKARIAEARERLDRALANISADKFEDAKIEIGNSFLKIKVKLWIDKDKIEWDWREKLKQEHESQEEADKRIDFSKVRDIIKRVKDTCRNSEVLEDLINQAKSLRDEIKIAKDDGDHGKAASFTLKVRELVNTAHHLGNVCEKGKDIRETVKENVVERVLSENKSLEDFVMKRIEGIKSIAIDR